MYTIVTAGHGSRYRFDGDDPKSPPPDERMTLEEAIEKAIGLEIYGDTVGLSCMVVHIDTFEIVWPARVTERYFTPEFGDPWPDGAWQAKAHLG